MSSWCTSSRQKWTGNLRIDKYMGTERYVDNDHSSHGVYIAFC